MIEARALHDRRADACVREQIEHREQRRGERGDPVLGRAQELPQQEQRRDHVEHAEGGAGHARPREAAPHALPGRMHAPTLSPTRRAPASFR